MPCWNVSTTTLDLSNRNVNIDTLKRTLEAQGYQVTKVDQNRLIWAGGSYNRQTGQIKSTYGDMSWVKTGYVKQMVSEKAKKFGWTIKFNGENQGEILKR